MGVDVHLSEDPMVLTVTVDAGAGRLATGRAWLHQPELTGRSGWQRRAADLAAALARGASPTDAQVQVYGDALLRIAATLFTARTATGTAPAPHGRAGDERDEDGDAAGRAGRRQGSLDVVDMVRTDDIRAGHAHAQQQSRSLLARLLESLAMRAGASAGGDDEDDNDWDADESTGGGRRRGRRTERRLPYARDTVPGLDRAFRAALLCWTAAEPTTSTVADAAGTLSSGSQMSTTPPVANVCPRLKYAAE